MASKEELACVYAALILYDEKLPITAENIESITKAANVKVPNYLPMLFAKMLEGKNIEDLLFQGGAVAAPVAVAAAAGGAAAAPAADDKKGKKEEKKKEESSDDGMDGGMFDLFG
ncbi:putative large subunit ribosomal protein LP1 [Blattamonas nauphoetae]|uniref:Large subunit ribosomal protein LP1 n=1 Tax=Blattamonas nauphoetae TaxID=2049346 RepID=A0ABQ9X6K4_9EUKA|nr:putative large subunit ribosomal protein LP1 [Blattamonas nauphoetae]KAK2963439.1 putative large subunit ribosomal protein LP1 [Blattamonas nauphoetae]